MMYRSVRTAIFGLVVLSTGPSIGHRELAAQNDSGESAALLRVARIVLEGHDGFRVLYQRTANLVQKLQAARRDLALEAAIRKLHKYHLVTRLGNSWLPSSGAWSSTAPTSSGSSLERPRTESSGCS